MAQQYAYEEDDTDGRQHPATFHVVLLARLIRIDEADETDRKAEYDTK
jgi:hypothetical protein